jgi:hypothetical protein
MPIDYVLFENNITPDPDDYTAAVRSRGTAELEAVIERMMRQGSTVTRADIVSVLEDFTQAVERMLLEGLKVNTPLANFGASIKGIFEGQEDSYDPDRHQVTPTVAPGKHLRAVFRAEARPVKQEAVKPKPNPLAYVDMNSEARDSVLTPGGLGQIIGHRLKFEADDPAQGVFFIAAEGAAARAEVVGRNKPAELMFLVPMLPAGAYTVEVRARFGSDDLRVGALDVPLSVP